MLPHFSTASSSSSAPAKCDSQRPQKPPDQQPIMETFEINSLLRLLRSSIKSTHQSTPTSTSHLPAYTHPNPAASTVNFIASGQRFETLKTLRRQLRRHFSAARRASTSGVGVSISYSLVQNIFEVLKSILANLVLTYFESHPEPHYPQTHQKIVPTFRKSTISVETVFAAAVQRNEILEIIQILLSLISKCSLENLTFTESFLNKRSTNLVALEEEVAGRIFLPEVITLLGHESSEVIRFAIRFLTSYMSRTHNLQRFQAEFIRYGLEATANPATQFGALQAVGHLFIRDELKPENLSLLVGALGRLLLAAQSANRHLFYPTYVALERLNNLLGGRRFYRYLQQQQQGESIGPEVQPASHSAIDKTGKLNVVMLYENLQKRAPSPCVFLPNEGSFPAPPEAPAVLAPAPSNSPAPRTELAALFAEYGDHDFIEDTGQSQLPPPQPPVVDLELEQELAELEELDNRLAESCGQGAGSGDQRSHSMMTRPTASGETPPTVVNSNSAHQNPNPNPTQHRSVSFASPPTTSQIEADGSRTRPPVKSSSGRTSSQLSRQQQNVPSTSNFLSSSQASGGVPGSRSPSRESGASGRARPSELTFTSGPEEEEFEDIDDIEMATTVVPGLAGYTALDADTLANMEYIPTLKDYYPYASPYYYDPLYPLAPHLPPHRLPPVVTSPLAPLPPLPAAVIAPPYGPLHLLRFGIFPRALVYQALSSLAEEQFAAVQAIVRIVRDAPLEHLVLIVPHLDEFLTVFIGQLLLDGASNFKVILWTLDIIELLSERLGPRLGPYLSQIVLLLSRRLGDNRIVIRDSVIKVYHALSQRYPPQELLDLLFKHVSTFGVSGLGPGFSPTGTPLPFTSSAKLREETANRVTATVSTFPRAQLNLPKLCFDVAPLLVDRRALVRLAALECTATLAQALGPHKLGALMTAVHSLDSGLTVVDSDRLIAAIQARLARRSLPRTGPDGSVTYVLRVPGPSEQPWYYRRIYDADLEWIALGATGPVSGISLISGTALGPAEDKIAAATKMTSTHDEERMRHLQEAPSLDSEDIPPPVHHSRMAPSRSTSRQSLNKIHIDPAAMADDQASFVRNFADYPQQREVETRAHSLERSRTAMEDYYNSKADHLMEKMVRGESIDDAELLEAARSPWMPRSSVESIEAWRQYFSRFKKQLAEMALNGSGGRYGSRPNSGAIFYGSPLPPYGLTPAAYYYYYHNGLSASYHDLSSLQQENMEQIMKRSGFIPEGQGLPQAPTQEMVDVSESPIKSPPAKEGRDSWSAKYRSSRGDTSSPEGATTGNGNLKAEDDYPLERSVSMPAIPGSSKEEQLLEAAQEVANVISDEVIQEIGMWEQVIQEEKKEGGGAGSGSRGPSKGPSQEEVEQQQQQQQAERESSGEYSIEEMQEREESPTSQRSPSPEAPAPATNLEVKRKQSIVPIVSVQQPTPNLSAGSESDRRSPVSEEELIQQKKIARRESKAGPSKQDSIGTGARGYSVEETPEASGGSSGEEQGQDEERAGDSSSPERQNSVAQAEDTSRPEEETTDSGPGAPTTSSPETKPKSGGKPSSGPPVSKAGPPGPPARRLSRAPQQLYIKTTPAIPMNANIQHILGNVARTEGPFELPQEAVKAAVIALHDNAWTTKVEGMLAVVRLATFHPHFLLRDQHQVALHLIQEIRNLRSTVSRSAIFTIGELFCKLKSQIEPEMDILAQALLYKVGENSIFIREDIDRALQHMIDYMPQTRAALALITYGSNHRNTYVRRTSAQFLASLVEKMGAMKCLLGPRDIGEHLLPAAARFIQDGSAHTRYFGRRIFAVLLAHPLFDKLLRRHVSPGTYRNICGMLETIKRRGIGDRPADLFTPAVQPKQTDPRRLVVIGENK